MEHGSRVAVMGLYDILGLGLCRCNTLGTCGRDCCDQPLLLNRAYLGNVFHVKWNCWNGAAWQ